MNRVIAPCRFATIEEARSAAFELGRKGLSWHYELFCHKVDRLTAFDSDRWVPAFGAEGNREVYAAYERGDAQWSSR